jgi:hypothetical protein
MAEMNSTSSQTAAGTATQRGGRGTRPADSQDKTHTTTNTTTRARKFVMGGPCARAGVRGPEDSDVVQPVRSATKLSPKTSKASSARRSRSLDTAPASDTVKVRG